MIHGLLTHMTNLTSVSVVTSQLCKIFTNNDSLLIMLQTLDLVLPLFSLRALGMISLLKLVLFHLVELDLCFFLLLFIYRTVSCLDTMVC